MSLRDCHCSLLCVFLLGATLLGACDESKPPKPQPASLAPLIGSTHGGDSIAIVGAGFTQGSLVLFDGVPAQDVLVTSGVITAKTPAHAEGMVVVEVFNASGGSAEVPSGFEYAAPVGRDGNPRLVGAISLGNTSVRLSFNEPVLEGAANAESYSIVQANVNAESGALPVVDVELSEDGLSVLITTRSQNEVVYDLIASGIRDLEGNLLATPEPLVNPGQVQFGGTPPSGELVDTDGDGIADHIEQSGWTVTIELTNGDIMQTTVTSDPTLPDTDLDGLDDAAELLAGSNPRNEDSDGDTVVDLDEVMLWHSWPTRQDSDGDQLSDSLDVLFETSLILADTDGDGMDDRAELFLFNRNPLIADLPLPQIVVGDYSLQVQVTSSYTDVTGTTKSAQSTLSTGISQAQSQGSNRSDTRSTESANKSSTEFGGEVSYGKDGWGGKVHFDQGFEQSSARGFSSTVETQTATESQQTFENSVSEGFDQSELRSVTRTIDSATVQATINVANQGEVPFTITNIELSLQRQDRSNGGQFSPVATLRPSGGQALSLNLGPFDSERGPIIFENTDIFPNIVEELIREPQGLIFKVANFDVLDAQGENFAFSAATVSSRTAGITIDYGTGVVESYRIATHSAFGADRLPTGISMERALELAGLQTQLADTALPSPLPANLPTAVASSVGTLREGMLADGTERLVRIRGVQNDLASDANPDKRFWTVQTNNSTVTADADFSTIRVRAGDEFLLLHTRDIDQDGLHELEENFYGSSDRSPDSDGDGLLDIEEVRVGWSVFVKPGVPRLVFSSPARVDSDLDGLSDEEEQAYGTDPNKQDTDNDGLSDRVEILSTLILPMGESGLPNPLVLELSPYTDEAIFAEADGTVTLAATGDDLQIIAVGDAALASDLVIAPGDNGRIDTSVPLAGIEVFAVPENIQSGPSDALCETAATGSDIQVTPVGQLPAGGSVCIRPGAPDFELQTRLGLDSTDYIRARHEGRFTLDPTRADTDFDGLSDGRETRVGINPNYRDAGKVIDSDDDGLRDAEEEYGWEVCPNNPNVCTIIVSNASLPDTDFDGLLDVFEFAIKSDPTKRDTDGDGLSDLEEFNIGNPAYPNTPMPSGYYDSAALATAVRRCNDLGASACSVPAASAVSTNVLYADSDSDGREDFTEITIPWLVYGVQTFSSPNDANFDGDGFNDLQELAAGTSPVLSDTDIDGRDDHMETPLGLNPLVKDKRIRLTAMHVRVLGGCDGGTDAGEFSGGAISLAVASDPPVNLATFASCSGVGVPSVGADCTGDSNATPFILLENESFTISSAANLEDDDGSCGPACDDDLLGDFSNPYAYGTVVGATITASVFETPATGTDCQLDFVYTINID